MSHIYITDNGSFLGVDGGRYVIRRKDELVRSIPRETVESISIFGNSSLSTKAVQQLLLDGTPVNFFSGRGKYYGILLSTDEMGRKIGIRRKQFRAFEDESFRLSLAREMITAKIHNQRVLLNRICEEKSKYMSLFNQITVAEQRLPKAVNEAQLMGYEGMAARAYFHVMGQSVDPDFRFSKRSRRPPRDAFNSMLSLGYTLLAHEAISTLISSGLDPYGGILHAERNGGASLAFDLMEEWRAPIVDAIVSSMVNGHEIRTDDFMDDENGNAIYLTNAGMRKYLKKYERKMATRTKYLTYESANAISFRDAIFRQCSALISSIESHDAEQYHPFRIR